jgi:hypothetical protein
MKKLFLFSLFFILTFQTLYFSADDIWEHSKKIITSKKYPPQFFTIDLYNYLDINTVNEMFDTQKYIYEKYNIPNYVFFVSHLNLKKSSLEKTTFEISKKICKDFHFHCDRSIIVLFSIEDRVFRIRTGAEIKNSILTNYMCEKILDNLKFYLRRKQYSIVHRNLLIDIKNNLDFPEKYNKKSVAGKVIIILFCTIFMLFFIGMLIFACIYYKNRKLNKIKKYLKNCKNNKKIPADVCVICLDILASLNNKNETVALECQHQFHERCIEKWLEKNNICPLCRTKLEIDNLNKKFSMNTQDNSIYQNDLLDIHLRNIWDVQQIINPSYENITYSSLFETPRSSSSSYYNNDYSYSFSHYSCDNDNDHDFGGGASSSW